MLSGVSCGGDPPRRGDGGLLRGRGDGSGQALDWTWVQELEPDGVKVPPEYPQGEDAQDLNEGRGVWTDWVFIGYGAE